jgi:hypothetical protein
MDKPDLYEMYLRDANGNTYHVHDTRDGWKRFLWNDGYRISINIDGVVLTLRKGVAKDSDIEYLDSVLDHESVECLATLRGHK